MTSKISEILIQKVDAVFSMCVMFYGGYDEAQVLTFNFILLHLNTFYTWVLHFLLIFIILLTIFLFLLYNLNTIHLLIHFLVNIQFLLDDLILSDVLEKRKDRRQVNDQLKKQGTKKLTNIFFFFSIKNKFKF